MTQKFYAGIGSRETPELIQPIMSNLAAHLYGHNWTLRSGGADSADQAFEAGHDMARDAASGLDQKEIYLPWRGYNHNKSMLHPDAEPFTESEMETAEHFHPNWRACSPAVKKLHARNVRIMMGISGRGYFKPSSFVLCWTKNGVTTGGTGQAIRMAQALGIKVFNLGTAPNSAELERLINEIERFQRAA